MTPRWRASSTLSASVCRLRIPVLDDPPGYLVLVRPDDRARVGEELSADVVPVVHVGVEMDQLHRRDHLPSHPLHAQEQGIGDGVIAAQHHGKEARTQQLGQPGADEGKVTSG